MKRRATGRGRGGRSARPRRFPEDQNRQCPTSLSQEIAPHLPYLRRYARALTGSQTSGDAHVTACLEAIVADPAIFDRSDGVKVGLYQLFHELWHGLEIDDGPTSRRHLDSASAPPASGWRR